MIMHFIEEAFRKKKKSLKTPKKNEKNRSRCINKQEIYCQQHIQEQKKMLWTNSQTKYCHGHIFHGKHFALDVFMKSMMLYLHEYPQSYTGYYTVVPRIYEILLPRKRVVNRKIVS
jgi:hypothetical protein